MKKQSTRMSRAVSQLEHIYNSLNADFFSGELPVPIITVQSKPGTYGHCTTSKVWQRKETGAYELNIAAEVLNYPIEETLDTIEEYNGYCETGKDLQYYKTERFLTEIKTPPFYGTQTMPSPIFLTVLGGLRTDVNMRVCDENDEPIPGLYNVGTMVGDVYSNCYNFLMEGQNYGMNCVTFGYVTGKFIAENE